MAVTIEGEIQLMQSADDINASRPLLMPRAAVGPKRRT
jgi:hypothetical protein